MKNAVLFLMAAGIMALAGCGDKQKEGVIVYQLKYILPDSLRSYEAYLPAKATEYFKGDSVATVQGNDEESTTMISHKPTDYMLALLKSGIRRFQVLYTKDEQVKELPDLSIYEFTKGKGTQKIANYNAEQYIMKNKFSGDTTSVWFTHDITIPPGFLTAMFKPELGVPLQFSTNQNGIVTKTTVSEVRFEPVPAGVFTAPPNYKKMTPQELREMPVEN